MCALAPSVASLPAAAASRLSMSYLALEVAVNAGQVMRLAAAESVAVRARCLNLYNVISARERGQT